MANLLPDLYPHEAEDQGGVDANIPNLVVGEENVGDLEGGFAELIANLEWIANIDNVDDYVWMLMVTPAIMKGKNVLVRLNFLN